MVTLITPAPEPTCDLTAPPMPCAPTPPPVTVLPVHLAPSSNLNPPLSQFQLPVQLQPLPPSEPWRENMNSAMLSKIALKIKIPLLPALPASPTAINKTESLKDSEVLPVTSELAIAEAKDKDKTASKTSKATATAAIKQKQAAATQKPQALRKQA
ncbi:hypothetical protein BS17DRAFT_822139 [Gyrodon lividus]|nr:hypothetical protein BS17DRAFT_822139 [Gyrodon lividus]